MNLVINLRKKCVFLIKIICLAEGTLFFFINENNFLMLKRGKYDGIRTSCVPIQQGQEPCSGATVTYTGLVSRVRVAGCREHTYLPLCLFSVLVSEW